MPPRLICYCTQDSTAWTDPLKLSCMMAGSDKPPPFQCTLENLINVVEHQRSYAHLLKTPDFLRRPEVQQAVQGSYVKVQWSADNQAAAQMAPLELYTMQLLTTMKAAKAAESGPSLPLRVTEAKLRQYLGGFTATAVVDLGGLAPGWFAGLSMPMQAVQVQRMVDELTAYVGWCCLLEQEPGQDMSQAYISFQKPVVPVEPAAGGASGVIGVVSNQPESWMPADSLFQQPSWCSRNHLQPLNWNISLQAAQHPCHYLANVSYTQALRRDIVYAVHKLHRLRATVHA